MKRWKSVAIWALCWRCDMPHRRRRIQHPDHPSRCSSNTHGMCETYSNQSWDVSESLGHEWGEDRTDLYFMVWGNCEDSSSPGKLRPSMCLHFSSKWIISTIVFIAEIGHQVLAQITCSHAAMIYHCKTWMDAIDWFQTHSSIEIRKMIAWEFTKDRSTCPTNVREVSSTFPSCSIIVFTINLAVQVLICSDSNCR